MSMRDLTRAAVGAALLLSVVLPATSGATQEAAVVGRAAVVSRPERPTRSFTATLPGLGLLIDSAATAPSTMSGATPTARPGWRSSGPRSRMLVASGTPCGALPTPAKEVCYGALAVAAAALESEATVIAQCAFQDSLVDGASSTPRTRTRGTRSPSGSSGTSRDATPS